MCILSLCGNIGLCSGRSMCTIIHLIDVLVSDVSHSYFGPKMDLSAVKLYLNCTD